MRNVLLVLHIIAVAAWLGGNLTLAFAGSVTAGADPAARRWWALTQAQMARVYFNVAGIVVLITGVLLVVTSDSVYSFADMFVSIGFLAVIVGAVLGITQFAPGARGIAAAVDSGDEAEERRINGRLAMFGMVDSLVLVVAIVAMVAKWGVG